MSVAISSHYQNTTARPTIAERRHLVRILPTSTVPTAANPVPAGNQISFLNLPTSSAAAGSFISVPESYMEITVRCNTNADANARLPRGGVASLIERVQVLSNGVPCEDTLHYNQLINLLQDMSSSDSDKKGVPARLQGLGEAGGVGADDLYERGALFNNPGGGAVQTEAKTFLVPLQSRWFQSISMVPVPQLFILRTSCIQSTTAWRTISRV